MKKLLKLLNLEIALFQISHFAAISAISILGCALLCWVICGSLHWHVIAFTWLGILIGSYRETS